MTSEEYSKYQRAMKFAENHPHLGGGLSNVYVFQKSVDGVVTDEYYGMNVLTDLGFKEFFNTRPTSNSRKFAYKLYVGNGYDSSQDQNIYTPRLFKISNTAAATVDSNKTIYENASWYNYPMYYGNDGNNHNLISLTCKYMDCYFKSQADGGAANSFEINEFGLAWNDYNASSDTGDDYKYLWTHSWLYNLQGEVTRITKETNARLDITIYFVLSFDKSLIEDGWQHGRYMAMTTMNSFLNHHLDYDQTYCYTYKKFKKYAQRTTDHGVVLEPNNSTVEVTQTIKDVFFKNESQPSDAEYSKNGYIDGFIKKDTGYVCFEHQKESSAVNVDQRVQTVFTDPRYTRSTGGSSVDPYYFNDVMLGWNSSLALPFSNVKLTSFNLYDWKANPPGYSINTDFTIADPNSQYNDISFASAWSLPISYSITTSETGDVVTMKLFVNTNTTDPIVAFNNGGIIFATDTYWIKSSWQQINTPGNIPQLLQQKHFYITDSNTTELIPIRGLQRLELKSDTSNGAEYKTLPYQYYGSGGQLPTYSVTTEEGVTNGYYIRGNYIYFYDINKSKKMEDESHDTFSVSSRFSNDAVVICYKNYIFAIDSVDRKYTHGACYYFTNITDIDNITTTRCSLYADSNFNGFIKVGTGLQADDYISLPSVMLYITETKCGLIGIQTVSGSISATYRNQFVALHIGDDVNEHRKHSKAFNDVWAGCCIVDSDRNRFAIYKTNNTIELWSYNNETHAFTLSDTISNLPTNLGEVTSIFGYGNHLWVTYNNSGNGASVYVDLINSTYTQMTVGKAITGLISRGNMFRVRTTCEDGIIVVYESFVSNPFATTWCIDTSTPTKARSLSDNFGPVFNGASNGPGGNCLMKLVPIRYNQAKTSGALALVFGANLNNSNISVIGSFRGVIDIGQFINHVEGADGRDFVYDYANYMSTDSTSSVRYREGLYVYGPNVLMVDMLNRDHPSPDYQTQTYQIPIEFLMPHRMIGTTGTISAFQNTRRITAKQWKFKASNRGVYSGNVPPGYPTISNNNENS